MVTALDGLIKIGGSAFDLGASCIRPLCTKISELAESYRFVLTVGGGPPHDLAKNLRDDYGLAAREYQRLARLSVLTQAELLAALLGTAQVALSGRALSELPGHALPIIPFALETTAPEPLPSDTDAHAIAIAEQLQIHRILFLKDTLGVFSRDPATSPAAPFHDQVSVDDFSWISRLGVDGRDEHVIENDALRRLRTARFVREIVIADCKQTDSLEKFFTHQPVGSRVIAESVSP